MSGSRKKPKPKPFESKGEKYLDKAGRARADTSANLYESMLTSEAFMDLKPRQRLLYVYAKAQYYGKRKPKSDFKDVLEVQSDECFYLNIGYVVDTYGLYTTNTRKEFYGDIKVLIEHGFIDDIVNGQSTKSRSIYRFSDRWKNWKKT